MDPKELADPYTSPEKMDPKELADPYKSKKW
jgi:hypothetical protein